MIFFPFAAAEGPSGEKVDQAAKKRRGKKKEDDIYFIGIIFDGF